MLVLLVRRIYSSRVVPWGRRLPGARWDSPPVTIRSGMVNESALRGKEMKESALWDGTFILAATLRESRGHIALRAPMAEKAPTPALTMLLL